MAVAKRKGLRTITVDDKAYFWRVKYSEYDNLYQVRIGVEAQPRNSIVLCIRPDDSVLEFPDHKNQEMGTIGPKLIRTTILHVIDHYGWEAALDHWLHIEQGAFKPWRRLEKGWFKQLKEKNAERN